MMMLKRKIVIDKGWYGSFLVTLIPIVLHLDRTFFTASFGELL